MPACSDRIESLMLSVYEELDTVSRSKLDEHLKNCADCSREKRRLESVLGLVRENMVSSPLTSTESTALASGVHRKLAARRPEGRWPELFQRKRALWFPVAATAGLLLLLTTFLSYDQFGIGERSEPPKLDISKQLPEDDVELIQHLDLLKNLDTLEKLSRVVHDVPGRDSTDMKNQGARGNVPYGFEARAA